MERFYEAPPWREVITTLGSVTLTFLDRLATNRSIAFAKHTPTAITGNVPADNPEVNLPFGTGRLLQEGNRLIYAFRREGPSAVGTFPANPWVCRAAGIVMQVRDEGRGDAAPISGYAAYDPWAYLYRRPVVRNAAGALPVADGLTYLATRGNEIIIEQLEFTEDADGPVFLDYGQTAFYGGTIENTPVLDEINFQRGASIGELLDTLVATGTLEVKITAVYDPLNRPGIVGELNIYDRMGQYRPGQIFGWDSFPQNLVDVTRVVDGQARVNRAQYYAGAGGPPAVQVEDATSIAKYRVYFEQRFWPGQDTTAAVELMAERTVALLKDGQITYTATPAAERAPVPLVDYDIGDRVPVWATQRLREPLVGKILTVEAIPITIGNDQLERVNGLLLADTHEEDVT